DRNGRACAIERREKRQALDVIPVIVRQQDRNVGDAGQRLADSDDARAGIEDEPALFAVADDLEAGSVAAVFDGSWRGVGNRTTHAPETHTHRSRAYYSLTLESPGVRRVMGVPRVFGVRRVRGQESRDSKT